MTGPIEERPISPNPSDRADFPPKTELIPIPKDKIIGTVTGPVVTPPASKAMATNVEGVKKDKAIMKIYPAINRYEKLIP